MGRRRGGSGATANCRIATVDGATQRGVVIASIGFKNFKALRSTRVGLVPFNLVIGPNGSGKTSLIEALLRLSTLSKLPLAGEAMVGKAGGPEIEFHFSAPYESVVVQLSCVSELVCDTLRMGSADPAAWSKLRPEMAKIRSYAFDPEKMANASRAGDGSELASDGANLAAVLAGLRRRAPAAFAGLAEETVRILPEFQSLEIVERAEGRVEFGLRLAENGLVPATELSQGVLHLVAILALAFNPEPPRVLCIEEVDRGIHPRMLREIRDALYRLSYPKSFGSDRHAVQIVATTHSPYFIDLFREHPEEIIISHKHGRAAHFERLADRPDLPELLREGALGDMWFSGILGGVPEER